MKKTLGFTLIELILVLGLLTTIGAMAAPQFTAVFDHSKDDADVAQMDQLMVAFQLEQAPFFKAHEGEFDLLKSGNVTYTKDVNGNVLATMVDPQKAKETLQSFLNAVVNPGSAAYMEGAQCVNSGQTQKEGETVFLAKVDEKKRVLWIVCREDQNQSIIRLKIPGTDTISYVYSDEELENGTWLIVGDDDRLRTDYVEDYLKKDKSFFDKFNDKLKQNTPYQYKTTFLIETEMVEETSKPTLGENIVFNEEWIIWAPQDLNGIAHTGMKKGIVPPGIEVEYRFDGGEKKRLNSEGISLKVLPNGKSKPIEFWFSKEGEKTLHRKYDLDISRWFLEMQTAEEGYVKCKDNKNPHIFHYLHSGTDGYIDDGSSGSSGEGETIDYPKETFVAGFIFNCVNDNSYDFFAFEQNDRHETELRYYKMPSDANAQKAGQLISVLKDFSYNKAYTMDLIIEKGETTITLSDGLLNQVRVETGNDLHPAIGYYMSEEKSLRHGEKAVAEVGDLLPVMKSKLKLMGRPIFGTSDSENPSGTESVEFRIQEISPRGPTNLVHVEITSNLTNGERGILNWKIGSSIGNGTYPATTTIPVEQNGEFAISLFANNQLVKAETEIRNWIAPIEIQAAYEVLDNGKYQFVIGNFEEIEAEIASANPEDVDYVIELLSTNRKRFVDTKKGLNRSSFSILPGKIDPDNMGIVIRTAEGEEIGRKAIPFKSTIPEPTEPSMPSKPIVEQTLMFKGARLDIQVDEGTYIHIEREYIYKSKGWKTAIESYDIEKNKYQFKVSTQNATKSVEIWAYREDGDTRIYSEPIEFKY